MTPNEAKRANISADWNARSRKEREEFLYYRYNVGSLQYQNAISCAYQTAAQGWNCELNALARMQLSPDSIFQPDTIAAIKKMNALWSCPTVPMAPTPIAEAVGRFYAALEGGQVSAPASQGGGIQANPAGAKPIPAQALKGWAQGRYMDSARMGWRG